MTTPHSPLSDLLIDITAEELIPLIAEHSSDKVDITHQRWNFSQSLEEWILMVMPFLSIPSLQNLLDHLAQSQEDHHQDHHHQDHQQELRQPTDQVTPHH